MTLTLTTSIGRPAGRALVRSLCGAALFVTAFSSSAFAGPFDIFAGKWAGTGTILVGDGGSERIRCQATYNLGPNGTAVSQILRCASDSYRFDLTTNVESSGGQLSGEWGEASRGVNGTLQGRMTANGDVQATVSTVGFNANLNVSVRGNRQTISIRSDNTDLRGVDISLTKS